MACYKRGMSTQKQIPDEIKPVPGSLLIFPLISNVSKSGIITSVRTEHDALTKAKVLMPDPTNSDIKKGDTIYYVTAAASAIHLKGAEFLTVETENVLAVEE